MLTRCPDCGAEQSVDRELTGFQVDCRGCGQPFTVKPAVRKEQAPPSAGLPWKGILLGALLLLVLVPLVVIAAGVAVWMLKKPPEAKVQPVAVAQQPPTPAEPPTRPRPGPIPVNDPDPDPEPPPQARGRIDSSGTPGNPVPPGLPAVGTPADRPAPARPAPVVPVPPQAPGPDVEFPRSAPRPAKESTPGYYTRKIHGFNVLISRMAYDQSDEADRRPLGYLEHELGRIAELLPPDTLAAMAKVPLWVEWDHTRPENVRTYGVYYGGHGEGLSLRGIDPRKAKCVCLLSLKTAYRLRAEGKSQSLVMLHELAHAVHDQVMGSDNALVRNTYRQAMARKLYDRVIHFDGTPGPAYAATNDHEYFAELSCAYLDRLDYTPQNRAELRDHDSVGYELMAKVWGTPEQIDARKRKAKAKKLP